MTHKKWLLIFITTLLLTSSVIGLFNTLVDPFGLFGDPIIKWDAYNMTNNPRIAKIGYLDRHHESYDSFIIGCSKTSSLLPQTLNQYFPGASFYNLMMYGGDLYDIEMTTKYVLEHYETKNIVINLGIEEAVAFDVTQDKMKSILHGKVDKSNLLLFYSQYIFMNPKYSIDKLLALKDNTYLPSQYDVFVPETGSYDKSRRDVESISDLEEYMASNSAFLYDYGPAELEAMMPALKAIEEIKNACEEKDVSFTLVLSPVTDREMSLFPEAQMIEYWREMAKITDYWDFTGYNEISGDNRYFYDNYHFRNAVGDMMLAKMYNNDKVYVPSDFGYYVKADNVEAVIKEKLNKGKAYEPYSKRVPILMYHHIGDGGEENGAIVSRDKFLKDMQILKSNGYSTVFYQDVVNYVENGQALPDKPVIVSFDDGYLSNYEAAYPILKSLDMKATISVIGMSMGKTTYKTTNHSIIPHFTVDQGREMLLSGVIDLQNHSFAMHDVSALEQGFHRAGAVMKTDESFEAYDEAMRQDYDKMVYIIEDQMEGDMFVYTYPYGDYDELSEVLLKELGTKVTVTVESGVNEVIKGLPQSLLGLKRLNVTEHTDMQTLIDGLE